MALLATMRRRTGSPSVLANQPASTNEVCVAAFLSGKIRYMDISDTLARIMDMHRPSAEADLEEILRIDGYVRKQTSDLLAGLRS